MRASLIGLGVALLVAGLVLSLFSLVPIVNQRTESTDSRSNANCTVSVCFQSASLLVPQILTVSWEAGVPLGSGFGSVEIAVEDCGSTEPPANSTALGVPCGFLWGGILNASAAGSQSFLVPGGQWLIVGVFGSTGINGYNVTFSVSGSYPLVGTVLWVLGTVLILVGLALPARRRWAPYPPSVPWTAPPSPAASPPPAGPVGPGGYGPPPAP